MQYLKSYRIFESSTDQVYHNINNVNDYIYYQIPFAWFYENKEFGDDFILILNSHFVYDYIKDSDIENSLREDLSDVNLSKGWESDVQHSRFNSGNIHTKRIAKLVKSILNNEPLTPISFWISDNSYQHDCYNFIEDGNHRLRALQYLKYTHFPAYVYGSHEKYVIKELEKEK